MLMYSMDTRVLGVIDTSKTVVYNVTSLREGLVRLYTLVPPVSTIGHLTDLDFDFAYADYIMQNDIVFKEFFTIIYQLYSGLDVLLLFDNSDWSENIAESLFKLIQQRYGYNATRIDSNDDYLYAAVNDNSGFNPQYGLYNLDMDKERFSFISESDRLSNGGKPNKEDNVY